jgi:hypothetical protein
MKALIQRTVDQVGNEVTIARAAADHHRSHGGLGDQLGGMR